MSHSRPRASATERAASRAGRPVGDGSGSNSLSTSSTSRPDAVVGSRRAAERSGASSRRAGRRPVPFDHGPSRGPPPAPVGHRWLDAGGGVRGQRRARVERVADPRLRRRRCRRRRSCGWPGSAGAIAGGISMAAGEWISVSAQNELIERELEIERREIAHNAPAETAELADMYRGRRHVAGRRRHAPPATSCADPTSPSPCTPGPSSASTPAGWRRRGGPAPSRSSRFLVGAAAAGHPVAVPDVGHGADRAVGGDRRRRRGVRRGADRAPRGAVGRALGAAPGGDRRRRLRA